jgi:hypothetical protein
VIKTLKDPAALEREDVGGLLDDADFFPLARRLKADFAKLRDGEGVLALLFLSLSKPTKNSLAR